MATYSKERKNLRRTILEGDNAIIQWLKGKEYWNLYMDEYPDTIINFTNVDFSFQGLKERFSDDNVVLSLIDKIERKEFISFEGFNFNQSVSFSGSTFGERVRFSKAEFKGTANFDKTVFKDKVRFNRAKFHKHTNFNSQFHGSASFNNVYFYQNVDFIDSQFEKEMSFSLATFKGVANFNFKSLKGTADFSNTTFESVFRFVPDENLHEIKGIDFKGAYFDKLFVLDGSFDFIPDLRSTYIGSHFDMSRFSTKLKRNSPITTFKEKEIGKKADEIDSERLSRLKYLAQSQGDHERSLKFNADELRAKRWNSFNCIQSFLDICYSFLSSYGQSIFKPIIFLILLVSFFTTYTLSIADENKNPNLTDAVTLSMSTITPFISISRSARSEAINKLFYVKSSYYDLISFFYALLSYLLMFLIGLGLRNRFRI